MSSDDSDLAESIADLTLAYNDNYCILSITALLLYDWAMTLESEHELVWSRRPNVASVLYVLARVSGPLYYLSTIVLLGYVDDTTYVALVYVQDVSALLPYIVWAVFSTYRGYALSGRKGYVAAIILTLTLVPVGVNIYNFLYTQPINLPPPTGCFTNIAISDSTLSIRKPPPRLLQSMRHAHTRPTVSYCSRCSVIVSEGIIIAWTWKCTGPRLSFWSKTGDGNLAQGDKSFREVLFENGSMFFLVLFLLNVTCLILMQVGPLGVRGGLSYFRDALTPLLVARFLLNLLALRKPADGTEDATDLFSTDVTGGLSVYTASDVVDSFAFSAHGDSGSDLGGAPRRRRSLDSLQFA